MANTLTNLIPTIYEAKDIVLGEMTGFIPAVTLDASGDMAAKDQTIRYPVVSSGAAADDITPAATGPDPAAVTVGSDTMTISKVKSKTFYWEAEESQGLGATMKAAIMRDQFAQCMRVIRNEVESDLAALYVSASRAYGTAGTTPFGSDLSALAQMLKILQDNGAPTSDLQLVLSTTASAALRTLTQLSKANEAGNDSLLRRGILLDLMGFAIRESAQAKAHTKGTGASYALDLTAGYAVGSTAIHVDGGTGTILAGDVLTNTKTSRDTNKYVVKTGCAGDSDQDIVLANPGNRVAWVNNDPVAVGNSYTANLAFSRSAIHAMIRQPIMPEGGDSADDVMPIVDEKTGITFQVAMYRQRRRVAYEVGLAWGVKAIKSEAIAILLG
jgi:hypothetical protein